MTPPVPPSLLQPMEIPPRELFGPGPSNMTLPIQDSASRSLLGHLHPEFIKVSYTTNSKSKKAKTYLIPKSTYLWCFRPTHIKKNIHKNLILRSCQMPGRVSNTCSRRKMPTLLLSREQVSKSD